MNQNGNRVSNLNTYLLGLVIALGAWTLKTVNDQGKDSATQAAKLQRLESDMQDAQKDIISLKVRFAHELGVYDNSSSKTSKN